MILLSVFPAVPTCLSCVLSRHVPLTSHVPPASYVPPISHVPPTSHAPPLASQKQKSKKDHELPNTTRSKYPDPLPADMSFIDSLTVSVIICGLDSLGLVSLTSEALL